MLQSIEYRGFRNLEPASLGLEAGGTLILGPNGAGKTSLLEAIYVLSTSRSFRTPRLVDCLRRPVAGVEPGKSTAESSTSEASSSESSTPGENAETAKETIAPAVPMTGFSIKGETAARQHLEMIFEAGDRHRRLNGERAPLGQYLGALPIVAWTAADGEILLGPPQARRRFLDRGVVGTHPAAIEAISRYRRSLAEKRRLLQTGTTVDELMPWNLVLAQAAAELIRRRGDYIASLRRSFEQVSEICRLGLPEIELDYRPSPKNGLDGADTIADHLEAEAAREMAMERPIYGPHRDEMLVRWRGRPVREIASAGERKALGLLLTAAHGRTLEELGVEPVYLLDDVDTELDQERLEGLWRHFSSARQLLASSNRPLVWQRLSMRHLIEVQEGRLKVKE